MEPERGVAVLHRLHDDADADEVLHVVELLAPRDHLLVDRPVVLRPALHVGVDLELVETRPQVGEDRVQELLALGRLGGDHLLDLGVPQRVEHRERGVLELPLHVGDAEPVRERRVDVEGLLRDAALLELGQRRDRAHVVEAVGELDEQDPDVLGHRHQHLAQRGGLLCLLGVELEAVELGDTVDDRRHVGPELALDVFLGDRRVLDRVVEQRGGDGDVVESQVGEHEGHTHRVGDVGLPGPTDLLLVRVAGDVVGVLDHRGVATAVALEVAVDQRCELGVDGVGASPGQHGASVGADLDARLRGAHLRTNSTGSPGVPLRRSGAEGRQRRFLRRC